MASVVVTMTNRLEGRTAIVTGASRGLGRSIALSLAGEGCAAVGVVARTETEVDETLPGTIHDTVAAIKAAGGYAVAIPADLANEGDIDRIVSVAHEQLGRIDLLVNNAALTVGGTPSSSRSATPHSAVAVHLDSAPSI